MLRSVRNGFGAVKTKRIEQPKKYHAAGSNLTAKENVLPRQVRPVQFGLFDEKVLVAVQPETSTG
jgi:hypothetical protein